MIKIIKNWARTLSWDTKGAMRALPWVLCTHTGVVPWCYSSPWRHYSCSMDTPTIWTELVLLSPSNSLYSLHQAQIITFHGALYTSIEFWRFSLDTRSGPSDCGASYPLGASIVRALHHSGWCTALSTTLQSCLYQHHLLLTRLLETTLFTWLFWSVCPFGHTNWCFTIWYFWDMCLAPSPTSIRSHGHGMHWSQNSRCFLIKFPDPIFLSLHSCGPWHSYHISKYDRGCAQCAKPAIWAFIRSAIIHEQKVLVRHTPPIFFF